MKKAINLFTTLSIITIVSPSLVFAMTTEDVSAQYKLYKHGDPVAPKVLGASATDTSTSVPSTKKTLTDDEKKVLMKGLKFASGSSKIISAPVKVGSKGEDVKKLQVFLGAQGHLDADPTGEFGAKTKAAVMKFQKVKGLVPDGKVGKGTIENISFDVDTLSSDK